MALYGVPAPAAPAAVTVVAMPTDDQVWEVFQRADTGDKGRLTVPELTRALASGPWRLDEDTCRRLVAMVDKERTFTVSYQDLRVLWRSLVEWTNRYRQVVGTGAGGDQAQARLQCALYSLGYRLPVHTVSVIAARFPATPPYDRMSETDFIRCCALLNNMTDVFRHQDTDRDGVITVDLTQFVTMAFEASH